ncbi:hypothetical protein VTL71DRAFT_13999 [Oculimacula yallundae]|uniref:HMG box domain-containing protein n=1 Tax=Oculimacula yallundae TaxID=86028 RepID=A0ABR4CNT2_9HELO
MPSLPNNHAYTRLSQDSGNDSYWSYDSSADMHVLTSKKEKKKLDTKSKTKTKTKEPFVSAPNSKWEPLIPRSRPKPRKVNADTIKDKSKTKTKEPFVPAPNSKWEPLIPRSRPKPKKVNADTNRDKDKKGKRREFASYFMGKKGEKKEEKDAIKRPWYKPSLVAEVKAEWKKASEEHNKSVEERAENERQSLISMKTTLPAYQNWDDFVASRKGGWRLWNKYELQFRQEFRIGSHKAGHGMLGADYHKKFNYNGADTAMLTGEPCEFHGDTRCYCVRYKHLKWGHWCLFDFVEFAKSEGVKRGGEKKLEVEEIELCWKCRRVDEGCKCEDAKEELSDVLGRMKLVDFA